MQCECRGKFQDPTETEPGKMGEWITSVLENPYECIKAGFDITNELGTLRCSGTVTADASAPSNSRAASEDASHMRHASQRPFQGEVHEEPLKPHDGEQNSEQNSEHSAIIDTIGVGSS